MNATKHTNSTFGGRARAALKVALAATVLTFGAIGASGNVAHAGSFVANANARLMCGPGALNMSLPVVRANTTGNVIEMTRVLRYNYNTRQWVDYTWTSIKYAPLAAGEYQNGAWIDLSTRLYTRADHISVAPGAWYYLEHWVYIDGGWIHQASSACFA